MLGFIIGTLCLVGLIRVLRHGRGYGPGFGWGGCGGGHGWGGSRCGGEGPGWDSPRCGGAEPGCGGGWHRGGRHGGFGGGLGGEFGPRMVLRGLFERLDTTPGQEKVIFQAVDEVRDAMKSARHELGQSRADVAAAFGREQFDAETMGAVFSRHDDAIATVRKAFVGALSKVHEALDERQRRILAEIIETRLPGMRWGFGGGAYRGQGRGEW